MKMNSTSFSVVNVSNFKTLPFGGKSGISILTNCVSTSEPEVLAASALADSPDANLDDADLDLAEGLVSVPGSVSVPIHSIPIVTALPTETETSDMLISVCASPVGGMESSGIYQNYLKSNCSSPENSSVDACPSTAKDFDHMYASLNRVDGASVLAENCQLKEMLVSQLDLIQQQSETIMSRDKKLKELRVENEQLKQRLERMERRIRSPPGKGGSRHTNNNQAPNKSDMKGKKRSLEREKGLNDVKRSKTDAVVSTGVLDDLEMKNNEKSSLREPPFQVCDKGDTRIKSSAESDVTNVETPVIDRQRNRGRDRSKKSSRHKGEQRKVRSKENTPVAIVTPGSDHDNNVLEHMEKTNFSDQVKLITGDIDDIKNEEAISVINKVNRVTSLSEVDTSLTPKLPEFIRLDGEVLQSTMLYYVGSTRNEGQLKEVASLQRGVEVPRWRELPEYDRGQYQNRSKEVPDWRHKPMPPSYTMEGTENIEDDHILKRHQKHELDEKRRKRWDIQRLRQSQQVEKLRLAEARRGQKEKNKKGEDSTQSLLPVLEGATHIHVSDAVPVSAFGRPIPHIPHSSFVLPWTQETELVEDCSVKKSWKH